MNKKAIWTRSHYCGDLRVEDVDHEVVLMGWCQTRRDHGGVIFVDLRDYTGTVSYTHLTLPTNREV